MNFEESAESVITRLNLCAHPEGGFYIENHRRERDEVGSLTTIYFLLREGERSQWHRLHSATEVWLFHAGAPLVLSIAEHPKKPESVCEVRLGFTRDGEERLQAIVEPGQWQSARSLGAWSLVGCVVAPAFEFEDFELWQD